MTRLVKFYEQFYEADNVAGFLMSQERVVTADDPQLGKHQGDPGFVSFDYLAYVIPTFCEYCHSPLNGTSDETCESCGAFYEET